MGDLIISSVSSVQNIKTTVFERIGTQADKWIRGLVKINPDDFAEDFFLTIETELISYYSGGKKNLSFK
jgi:hypothetical protein